MTTLFNVLGTMSGTSFDGIDLAYVVTNGHDFLEVKKFCCIDYPVDIRCRLHAVTKSSAIIDVLLLEKDITFFYAREINHFLEEYNLIKPDFIAFHGQTVLHSSKDKVTLQLGCPIFLSNLCSTRIISDFRKNDMMCGGQGTPITPIYHLFLAKKCIKPVAVVNIGGIANITWISEKEKLRSIDSGPGIGLIDKWVNKHDPSVFYDRYGQIARGGKIDYTILNMFFNNDYFNSTEAKSLDKNSFLVDQALTGINLEDGAATLTEFTALAIKNAFDLYASEKMNVVLLCGGGRKNLFLKERIQTLLGLEVADIDTYGYNGDTVEAEAMAYIAARAVCGLNFTFPETTGVKFSQGFVRDTPYKGL